MAAGERHYAVGAIRLEIGKDLVFQRHASIEDEAGALHPVRNENRGLTWTEVKKALSAEQVAALESLSAPLIAFDLAREKADAEELRAQQEARKKANEEAVKKAKEEDEVRQAARKKAQEEAKAKK